jgi:GMP synthase (glutamine-hydrolysing)
MFSRNSTYVKKIHYLLLQTRNPGDRMAPQEIRCFARALDCAVEDIEVFDLLSAVPSAAKLQEADMVLLGGSGHYSAASAPIESGFADRAQPRNEWLERVFDSLREIHHLAKPTFASCWGFQAMARALGGECINDLPNAELGTIDVTLTEAGISDPVFGQLPRTFAAQAGHEDHVITLPADAVMLASSEQVSEQAFRFIGRPIYCTQFHPELDRTSMLERVLAYPEYVERIARMPYDNFIHAVRETREANSLLRKFRDHVLT